METNTKKSKEIDIIGIISNIIKERKVLYKFVIAFALIGVIVALSIPKTYTAQVVLAPEISTGGLGMSESLGDLASSFGFDLGGKSSMDAIYPEIYPEIFASTEFIINLKDVKVRLKEDNKEKTYYDHIKQDSKMPFWDYPMAWLANMLKKKESGTTANTASDPFKLSKDIDGLCNYIRGAISCQVDKKTSIITINVTDQDPLVAAILADTLQNRLQEYITNYRTKKARIDYEYYNKLYNESKAEYIKAQKEYASFADANQSPILEYYKVKQDELENEMQLKYNVYTQISAQLQNAKAKIQERTPAFTILENAIMPYKASSTPRSLIVIFFIFLGCVADVLWIYYIRDFLKKKNIKFFKRG